MISLKKPKEENETGYLITALLLTFIAHGFAMLSMGLTLLKGLPGGGNADIMARVTYIAQNPIVWKLGWLPWHFCAFSNIFLASAIWQTKWIPKRCAIVTVILTLASVIPDQTGQFLWTTVGVDRAALSYKLGDPYYYASFEKPIYFIVASFAAFVYALCGISWSWCFASGKAWSRPLTIVSVLAWSVFCFASASPILPTAIRPSDTVIAVANAMGFLLLELWFIMTLERVWYRIRENEKAKLAQFNESLYTSV